VGSGRNCPRCAIARSHIVVQEQVDGMAFQDGALFDAAFIEKLREWIATHHTVYPRLPPQGIERCIMLAEWRQPIQE
jgi:hypothetical protein